MSEREEKLRELIAKWRKREAPDYIASLIEAARTQCADELEALLAEPPAIPEHWRTPLGRGDEQAQPAPPKPEREAKLRDRVLEEVEGKLRGWPTILKTADEVYAALHALKSQVSVTGQK